MENWELKQRELCKQMAIEFHCKLMFGYDIKKRKEIIKKREILNIVEKILENENEC